MSSLQGEKRKLCVQASQNKYSVCYQATMGKPISPIPNTGPSQPFPKPTKYVIIKKFDDGKSVKYYVQGNLPSNVHAQNQQVQKLTVQPVKKIVFVKSTDLQQKKIVVSVPRTATVITNGGDCLKVQVKPLLENVSKPNSSNEVEKLQRKETLKNEEKKPVQDDIFHKAIFSKELRCMMYGFGDDLNPYTESVTLLEDIVKKFILDISCKAMDVSKDDRIEIGDLFFILRNDPRKYSRLNELLKMNNELKQARKAFDEVKYLDEKA